MRGTIERYINDDIHNDNPQFPLSTPSPTGREGENGPNPLLRIRQTSLKRDLPRHQRVAQALYS